MIVGDGKIHIKNPIGFTPFNTTFINSKSNENISVLSSVKPSICILGSLQDYYVTNYAKIPIYSTICYKNAITDLKKDFVKCI